MNTKSLKHQIEQMVCSQLSGLYKGRSGFTLGELNVLLVKCTNSVLIENKLNRIYWARPYKARVFIYNIKTKRAMLELGSICNPAEDGKLYRGFELHLMGGIFNNEVPESLDEFTTIKPNKRRHYYVK